jgi:alpha-mannosidase
MVENITLMRDFPSTPQTRCGTVGEFFQQLEDQAGDRLPVWNGELYLEHHRGTYTTQGRNKRANRKSEFLLHDAELLSTLASLLSPDYSYPTSDLRRAWELVCLNQFHDIIPGSSIGPVYAESLEQYAEVAETGQSIRHEALGSIADAIGADVLLANPTSFTRQDLAFWPTSQASPPALGLPSGERAGVQATENGWLLDVGEVPPYTVMPLQLRSQGPTADAANPDLRVTPTLLENSLLRIEFNGKGDIVRICDKQNDREVLPPGSIANQFQLFEDRPLTPDAWDIDVFYDDRMWLAEPAESVKVIESGPLRATLEVQRRLMHSDCVQRISLARNSRRIDFDTIVQWQERHTLLKVAFPVDALSPEATYEIQFGNVKRPTHRNTSWDWARFETCAQKWVDLSEGGYGVSLLNDCKYGHDIKDNVIRLTLLRGTTYPDPQADVGEHHFTYALFPHAGPWDEHTISESYALNDPMIAWVRPEVGSNAPRRGHSANPDDEPISLVSVDRPNVVVETVKRAESGQGIIVRLYESQRRRSDCTLTCFLPLQAAWRTDILERDREELSVQGHSVTFRAKPYQIVTLRLLPDPWTGGTFRLS